MTAPMSAPLSAITFLVWVYRAHGVLAWLRVCFLFVVILQLGEVL